jgi:hypothetical protein
MKSKKTSGLEDLFGENKAGTTAKQRIIWASFGEVGTLKTSFGLTAPGPILLQSLDRGTEGVVDVYLKKLEDEGREKDIYVVPYDANTHGATQDSAEETAVKIEVDFEQAIENGVRTIIWDKETQIYEIFKFAVLGAPTDAPAAYYPLFQRYRSLINKAKDADINFCVIQGMKDRWGQTMKSSGKMGANKTSDRQRRGMPEIDELMHINIEHVLVDGEFYMNIGKSRGPGGRDIQNTTIPYCEFSTFAQMVFPESEESDWV